MLLVGTWEVQRLHINGAEDLALSLYRGLDCDNILLQELLNPSPHELRHTATQLKPSAGERRAARAQAIPRPPLPIGGRQPTSLVKRLSLVGPGVLAIP